MECASMNLQNRLFNIIFTLIIILSIGYIIFIQNDLKKNFDNVASDILDILSHRSGPAKTELDVTSAQAASAIQSLDKGRKLVKERKFELAAAYFLNGINHDPGSISLIREFADTALTSGNPQLISQAQGVLELSVYQVPSKDMIYVIELLNKILAVSAPPVSEPPSKTQIEINAKNALDRSDPVLIFTKSQKVTDSIAEFQGILDQFEDIVTYEIKDALTKRLQTLYAISNISPTMEFLMNAIQVLKIESDELNPSKPFVESVLASVNVKLMNLWGVDMSNVPSSIQQKIKEYPQKLALIVETLQKKISADSYRELNEVLHMAESLSVGNSSDTIKYIQTKLQYVNENLGKITYINYTEELRKKYVAVEKRMQEFQRNRYKEYQQWALVRCKEAYRVYDEVKIFNDNDAIRMFHDSNLAKIDHALLTPEVNRVFNNVLQKIIGELPGPKAFEIDKEIAETKKMLLEDF